MQAYDPPVYMSDEEDDMYSVTSSGNQDLDWPPSASDEIVISVTFQNGIYMAVVCVCIMVQTCFLLRIELLVILPYNLCTKSVLLHRMKKTYQQI